MANNWFTALGVPQTRAYLSSSEIRNEFNRISAAFDRMPVPAGGTTPGFSAALLDSPRVENGLWLGGSVGSEVSPTPTWSNFAYIGAGPGSLVGTVLSSADRTGAFFRVNGTDRIAFGKRVDNTTPTISFFMDEKAGLVMGDATNEKATTTTTGFLYLPTVNGAPTGAATAYTGAVAAVVDRANNRLYIRTGGVWRYVALT